MFEDWLAIQTLLMTHAEHIDAGRFALPLQPIASGRYADRFERVAGKWRFADRLVTAFLLGDRSQHVVWHANAAGDR